jgi:phage terminase large subunit
MDVNIEYNGIYKPIFSRQSRFLIIYGGAGSGKSRAVGQKFLKYMLDGEREHRVIFCRKTSKSVRNSQFLLFKDMIRNHDLTPLFEINETRMEIKCTATGNELLSAGLDDVEKLKSFTDPTAIWVEEATEIKRSDFSQLNKRLRGKAGDKPREYEIVLTFNPVNKRHWIYSEFFTKARDDATILHTTYKDNKFIDSDYIEQLEGESDQNDYRVYTLGEWGQPREGLVYSYSICDDIPEGDECYGLDFGFNVPTALVKATRKENSIYVEEIIYKKGLTNTDLITLLERAVPRFKEIYADAAEPQRIEEIRRAGFNIKPANKSVKDGVEAVQRHNIHVLRGSENVMDELDNYQWKEHSQGYQMDEPVKRDDHAVDALRYAVHTHWVKKGGQIYGFV